MKVLFIGGSGIISSGCTELAIEQGIDLYHLNRGITNSKRPVPNAVRKIVADIRNFNDSSKSLENYSFNTVVDWISFMPEHLENNLKLFKGKTKNYLFISSASAYETPPKSLPITENTPLSNPFWQYSRNKIACEKYLQDHAAVYGMKYTIIRPSHTYDKTLIPLEGGYTVVNRMIKGKPVVVHGDGTSIWTLTHHRDFAKGLVGLLGNKASENNIFHITSDEWLSWNRIYELVADAFKASFNPVYIPSIKFPAYNKDIGASLIGDKAHSMIFDNTKIKKVVPDFHCSIKFEQGIKEIASWYIKNSKYAVINKKLDHLFDQMIKDYAK